ncbi:MAG: hypothetical protein HY718_04180 [Planctomycetes bacterium]|nr:hypothetical protein [Planctomycetota bacterium]
MPTIPATARREQAGTRAILFYGPVVVENRVQLLVLTKLRDAATRNQFIDTAKEELYNCMTGLAGELTQIAENLKPGDGKRPIRKSRG